MSGRYAFPAERRLKKKAQFECARSEGRKFHSRHFLVYARKNGLGFHRLGVAVSRKVGNAVARNRVKRRLREFFRLTAPERSGAVDFLVIAKSGVAEIGQGQTVDELEGLFTRVLESMETDRETSRR